uniref:Uncharacterized protein n=1 Tax=Solanum tuberosum TaxID=4113 RepID=M1D4X2_SOLTU
MHIRDYSHKTSASKIYLLNNKELLNSKVIIKISILNKNHNKILKIGSREEQVLSYQRFWKLLLV